MPTSRAEAPSEVAQAELLTLLHEQIGWLCDGAAEAKRVFTRWLLEEPGPPVVLAELLGQARSLAARHSGQLEALTKRPSGGGGRAATAILVPLEQLGADWSASGRIPAIRVALQRLSGCFATACASAAETALALSRFDLAVVLASWGEAWHRFGSHLTEPLFVAAE